MITNKDLFALPLEEIKAILEKEGNSPSDNPQFREWWDVFQLESLADRCGLAEIYKWSILRGRFKLVDKATNGWISVKEDLPKVPGFYLVIVDEQIASKNRGQIEIGDCYETVKEVEKGVFKAVLKFQDYVTHWQLKPEMPEQQ